MAESRRHLWRGLRLSLIGLLAWSTTATALPPAPPNDAPGDAELIGPAVPLVVYGTTVLAASDIDSTLPGLPDLDAYVDGPDVFYAFRPDVTDTYRVHLLPWQHAPLRSSDRRFTIYCYDPSSGDFLAGARASGSARPVYFDVELTAETDYIIGVDHDDVTHDNFPFTLMVDTLPTGVPEGCASAETLPSTLPVVVLNDLDGSEPDFLFEQSDGRCAVSGTTPTTAPGNDHVYHFIAPADGEYAVELAASGFDGVLYVADTCPPEFPLGCLGASNHSTGGSSGGKHEFIVVSLQQDVEYWIYVDNGSTSLLTGAYALIIDDAFNYEVSESEPSEDATEPSPVGSPLNGGQLAGPADQDWWGVTGLTGDRVYAWVNNGGSSNSTLDTELRFYAADGTTLIEYDDDDGDGADAPIEDLRYIYSTTSSVIAGARMTSDGTHFLQVSDDDSGETKTVHRYRFHVGVEPAAWDPHGEIEPNDDLATADVSGKYFFSGVIPTVEDSDFFAFDAEVGDRVFLAFDGDPERDSDGSVSAGTDPRAFHGKLVIYDPEFDILISDVSDSNSAQTGGGDYPAQAAFFVARTAGTHYVEVKPQSTSSQVGPEETYELAIFLNDAPPALSEFTDPLVTLTPDYQTEVIHGQATDDQPGDSGVCEVTLYANSNLQIANLGTLPAASVTFDIELIDPGQSGFAKLLVTDCAGNTASLPVNIDVASPVCEGFNFSRRVLHSLHGPLHIPDNQPGGPGIDGTIEVADAGSITDVNVTVTFETTSCSDLDFYLIAPDGTQVEIQTDRGGSSAFNITDATFDDDAEELMSILSSDEPHTGTWLPEGLLADFNGHDAQGTWKLNVRDDSSSQNGGSRLVRWSLDMEAGFPGPETFAGTASESQSFNAGIASIVLEDAVNVELNLPPDFQPGDSLVHYTVTLLDPTVSGSGTVVVTDLQDNTCQSVVSLNGLDDATAPANGGEVSTALTFEQEVQADVPAADAEGVVSGIDVPDSFLVGEVEVALTVDTKDVGRLAATVSRGEDFASLVNRVGMDERGSVGLTKNTFSILLDDDAPQADDAHLEPASGAIDFQGLHQPDGRGEFLGNGITTDDRDHMLFNLAGLDSLGLWDIFVGDFRFGYTSSVRSEFRRWALTLRNPCGPERYVGTATDVDPGTGICAIELAGGAVNLEVVAEFTPGDAVVDYRVELADPLAGGSGTLEIVDCNDNVTEVAIELLGGSGDESLPEVGGSVNPTTDQFEGTASDEAFGDTGVASVELGPWAENLQMVSVGDLPAATVDFVVGLADPLANGRGYVRVTDGCGLRSHVLVEIDALDPVCTGAVGTTRRYRSADLPQDIPDSDPAGVVSTIEVGDADIVRDVNVTLNITHPYDDDIEVALISPQFVELFSDIGSTGNDFVDTTLDDEAEAPIPDDSDEAPFTGSYQPEGGPALFVLDDEPAAASYLLRVVDDASKNLGTFESWSLTIDSPTFPSRYDGRVEDSETHDLGVCSIELLSGAEEVFLTVDPFEVGAGIVRYSVEPCSAAVEGTGTVRVTDCAGNTCDVPVTLPATAESGDLDRNGVIDLADHALFHECLVGPTGVAYDCGDPCLLGDFDGDGDVDLFDAAGFQRAFTGS